MSTPRPTSAYRVRRGCILSYRVFDVADEIRLDVAERLLADAPGRRRVILRREGAQLLEFSNPPLDIELGRRTVELTTRPPVDVALSARFFDYGAVSVEFEVPIEPGSELSSLATVCGEIYESSRLEDLARREVDALLPKIAEALGGKHDWRGAETYTVVFVDSFEGAPPATDLIDSPLIAKLLLGEAQAKSLGDDARRDVLRHTHSYFADDLAVIDWNSAFVLEPSGSRDIPEILEFATSQLLELRYYDAMLDAELGRIYDDFALARRDWRSLIRSPYARLARGVLRRFVELTEFTERVDNALKVVGDFYLARVYQSAVRRFRIGAWRESIDGKQALVARAYDLLKGDVEIRRSTLMEVIVIALITLELVLAIRGR